MPLVRPTRPKINLPPKVARAWKACPHTQLAKAGRGVSYERSPYHCFGDRGERPVRRGKPQTICPRRWGADEARAALRRGLTNANVSEADDWISDYPRYIWYRDGADVVYEARLSGGLPGTYHAYPLEADQVPKDVT